MNAADVVGYTSDGAAYCPDCASETLRMAEDTGVVFVAHEEWEEMTCDSCHETLGAVAGICPPSGHPENETDYDPVLDERTGRIFCDVESGEGDARVRLLLCPANQCIPDARFDTFVAAVETNADPWPIDVTGGNVAHHISIQQACDMLECTYEELRNALQAALPEASEWDWTSEEEEEDARS